MDGERIDAEAVQAWRPPVADAATDNQEPEDEYVAGLSAEERQRFDFTHAKLTEAYAAKRKTMPEGERWRIDYEVYISAMTCAVLGGETKGRAELVAELDDLDLDDIDDCDPADDEPDFVRDWVDED